MDYVCEVGFSWKKATRGRKKVVGWVSDRDSRFLTRRTSDDVRPVFSQARVAPSHAIHITVPPGASLRELFRICIAANRASTNHGTVHAFKTRSSQTPGNKCDKEEKEGERKGGEFWNCSGELNWPNMGKDNICHKLVLNEQTISFKKENRSWASKLRWNCNVVELNLT